MRSLRWGPGGTTLGEASRGGHIAHHRIDTCVSQGGICLDNAKTAGSPVSLFLMTPCEDRTLSWLRGRLAKTFHASLAQEEGIKDPKVNPHEQGAERREKRPDYKAYEEFRRRPEETKHLEDPTQPGDEAKRQYKDGDEELANSQGEGEEHVHPVSQQGPEAEDKAKSDKERHGRHRPAQPEDLEEPLAGHLKLPQVMRGWVRMRHPRGDLQETPARGIHSCGFRD